MNKNDFINNLIKLRKLDGTFKKTLFNEEYLITQSINQPLCSKNDLNKMKNTINKYLYKIFNSKEYQLKDNEINIMISIGMNYSDETKKLIKLPMSKIYDFIAEKHNLCNNEINFYRLEINNVGIYSYFNKINDSLAKYFDFDEIKQTRPSEDGLLTAIFSTTMQSNSRDYVKNLSLVVLTKNRLLNGFQKI